MSTTVAPAQVAVGTNRQIRKIAVLGAGIMGSRIAMHFAGIGVEAILLDIPPRELTEAEKKKGLTLESPEVRNRVVNDLFSAALNQNPSPIYDKAFTSRIKLGNFDDHLGWLSDVDWIIEVVVERLDIKKSLYDRVEKVRKPGTLITSNTSGIPMAQLCEDRSEDFIRNFAGTHFFNPPRYLPLLEIIPGPNTDPAVIDFLMHYGDLYLGKKTVLCKDTPAFIANRVGIYAIMELFHLVDKHGLTVEEVDKLTGPLIGHASSATFRTCDLVGLDTAVKVAKGIQDNCPNDEKRDTFNLPAYVQHMVDNNMWGDKSGQGFYKKTKNAEGKTEIYSLNLKTYEYGPQIKPESETLKATKGAESLADRLRIIAKGTDKHAQFLKESSFGLFAYVSYRIPEIADELYRLDAALCAGFGWKMGPFEQWDVVGVAETLAEMKAAGYQVAPWVSEMLANGFDTFYKVENGVQHYYDTATKSYQEIPGARQFVVIENLPKSNVLWSNREASLNDLGDGIFLYEFHSKANSLTEDVIVGLNQALDYTEAHGRGMVIANNGENFTVGANLFMVLMLANQKQWDQLDMAIAAFQNTVMRLRYSSVPVVIAPHSLTLGGGCEMSMHADSVVAAAETYIGLVEVGVGLIPGGGGTKEMALRFSDEYVKGDVEINRFQNYLLTIATAKVATSAYEAFNLNIFQKGKDRVVINKDRRIGDAKNRALELAEGGYVQRPQRKDIRVLGRQGLAAVHAASYAMQYGGYASEHDRLITQKVGHILCGGDLTAPSLVSEQYLLDLEREAFLSLCGTEKTLARIQHTLTTNKPLRN
jgi:3-hydroxyacyl-CoA dehydrogenase